ncbi:hypothetical protein, partial [Pantoea sp. CTOTU50773]|uniref:hypothetical protein n=1 Tax=Pantoea sp. CTOTU50773 TaxID=2953853 RepID=UPI0028B0BD70
LTFNQLVAGSNPARPTNVERRPKGAFLLSAICPPSQNLCKHLTLFVLKPFYPLADNDNGLLQGENHVYYLKC